jgi:asparagine synthetase B (glutamine-hydrolysing)
VWATWSWDGRALRAENDRYGMRPLYYAAWPGRLAISPSVPALLAAGAPADLDEAALAVFLRVGFFLGEDTPFRAIRALPPCARFEWRDGALHVSGQPPPTPRPQRLSRAAAIEGYIDLFRVAIARRLVPGDDAAVPLSGGRDSRHILLELCRAGRPPRLAVTMRHYPPFSDEDAAVATDVARAAGVPHVVLPQGGDRFAAEIEKNRRTGFCADEHAWMLPLAAYLRGRVRYAYDGIGGDVLSAGLFLTPERVALTEAGRLTDLAAGMAEYQEPWLAHLLAPAWAARLGRDVAIERLVHGETPKVPARPRRIDQPVDEAILVANRVGSIHGRQQPLVLAG